MRDLEIRGAGNLLGHNKAATSPPSVSNSIASCSSKASARLKGEKVKPRVEVQVRLDFLAMSPEESAMRPFKAARRTAKGDSLNIEVAREVAVSYSESAEELKPLPVPVANCYIPMNYISEAQHRIEMYRKLAQSTDLTSLRALKSELRDRFGPLPPAVDLMLKVAELKILASDRAITVIETKDAKLMITRNNDYIMLDGKFPRLTKTAAAARLNEIKRLVLAL